MSENIVETDAASKIPAPVKQWAVFYHAVLFVLGFSVVFIIGWGGAATLLGEILSTYKSEIAKIGGVVVITFGLINLGVLKLSWFYYDTRPQWISGRRGGAAASFSMGVFFAAGWTPCIGATLGAILTLGLGHGTSGQAMMLASGYALGLGIPFLAIGLGIDRASKLIYRFRQHIRKIEIFSGLLLITMGFMLMTDQLTTIAIWSQQNGLYFESPLGGAGTPTYFVAVLAGVLSFLSPCVLPLVPAYIGYLGGHATKDLSD
jgi:cytochrome c-type biogenesis protein